MLGSPPNRPCAGVYQVVIRCRHDCIRTSVRVGGRFGGRVEAFARPRSPSLALPVCQSASLVRKLDGPRGLVLVVIHRGGAG